MNEVLTYDSYGFCEAFARLLREHFWADASPGGLEAFARLLKGFCWAFAGALLGRRATWRPGGFCEAFAGLLRGFCESTSGQMRHLEAWRLLRGFCGAFPRLLREHFWADASPGGFCEAFAGLLREHFWADASPGGLEAFARLLRAFCGSTSRAQFYGRFSDCSAHSWRRTSVMACAVHRKGVQNQLILYRNLVSDQRKVTSFQWIAYTIRVM